MSRLTPEHFAKHFPKMCQDAIDACAQGDSGLANVMFQAEKIHDWAETRFMRALEAILGYPIPVYWEETRFDPYDSSFELKDVPNLEFQFTDEQWQAFRLLGFACAWICYTDGSERSYPGNRYKPARKDG